MNKKWIIISLIILTLTGGLLLIYNSTPRHFNKIELNKTNYILNKSNIKYIDTVVYLGLNHLNINGVSIFLRPITINPNYDEMELMAHIISGENNQYLIEIDDNNKSEIIKTISHELIHLQQFKSGKLKITQTYVIWKGDTIYNPPPYENREWEIEAVELGKILENKIKFDLYEKR